MTIQANFPNVQPSLLLDFANAKQLPPQVTFTRATTAAYYDGSTTAMAEQNLLTYSQDFSNAIWATDNLTKGSATNTAPDGTSTATLIYPTATGSASYLTELLSTLQGKTATFSVYMKAQNKTVGWLYHYTGAGYGTYYVNLSTGATQIVAGATVTATMTATNVGSGWYRVSVTFPSTYDGVANWGIGVADSMGSLSITANGTDGIYLWGAQLEQRSSATAYTATTTQAITNYIPVLLTAGGGQPRFDHNPTTSESLGLLIEEQRTNAFQYSADLGTSPWSLSSVAVSGNTIIAPDGTLSGDKIIPDATNNVHYVRQIVGSSTNYTFSCYFKAAEYSTVVMLGVSANHGAAFDLANGTVSATYGSATATITAVGNGWYRCATAISVSGTDFYIYVSSAGTYVGNAFSGIYAWGAQLEAASFPTSYIPTTSASATRAGDSATMTGANFSSWFNNSEGTLYVEASPQTLSSNSMGMASLTNTAGSSNSISMYYTGGNVVDVESLVNSVAQYTYLISRGSPPTKVAHGYKVNNSNVALNGTAYTPDTVCLVPPVNTLTIGTIYDGYSFPCNGTVRKLAYYPIRVTDAQLAALTS